MPDPTVSSRDESFRLLIEQTRQQAGKPFTRKTLLLFANLHRKRAEADSFLADLFMAHAEQLEDARPTDTKET